MSLDPPLNGLLWLPSAVAGPIVAALVLAFHKEAIKEFAPQCTKLDDDGYVQECILPIQLPSSALGFMSLSDVRSLKDALVFAGNASSKQAVIPPFSLPDEVDLQYRLPCSGALIANKIFKLPMYSSAAGAVAVGVCTLEKNDPDGHYLVGKRLFNELEIRFLKHPSELAGPPGPCTILIITALGAELVRVNPPMNGSPQELASMEQENKLTCHFQETVSEANWLEKKLKFQPDPRLMFDDPALDASLINVVLGNLVTGETLTMLDAQGNQLFEAAPGPRGFAQLRLLAELLDRGFELNLRTTSEGDDVRTRAARKTPGPFSMTLHGLTKSLKIPLVGGLIQAIPDESEGQRLLHLVAGQEVVTLLTPAYEPVRLQAQVRPGIVHGAHLLAPGLLLVGGESRRVPLRQIAERPNIVRRLRLGTRLLEVDEDGQVMLLRRAGQTDLIPFVAAQLARR